MASLGLPASAAQDGSRVVHLRRRLVPLQIFSAIKTDNPTLRRKVFAHEFGRWPVCCP